MWPFKRDKTKELKRKHEELLRQARDIQRSGDLKAYAAKIMEAKSVEDKIAALRGGENSVNNWHP